MGLEYYTAMVDLLTKIMVLVMISVGIQLVIVILLAIMWVAHVKRDAITWRRRAGD